MGTIVHVDMDAFYAACEIRENPHLQGSPVIIGGDPHSGRGVVTTCSYEARKFGISSAMPISKAYELCPEGVYMRPHHTLYHTVSKNVMNILREFADDFQQAGIDEAYLDVSSKICRYNTPYNFGKCVQKTISNQEKISCSVGVAPNKSVAKIASDYKKPGGITVVPPEKMLEFLRPLPVERISGVGKKTEEILHNHDITHIEQLQKADPHFLTSILGKSGKWLWMVANGKDERPVGYSGSVQSVGCEHTFSKNTKKIQDIYSTFDWIAQRLRQRLEKKHIEFKTVSIKVRLKGFDTYTRSKTFPYYTNAREPIIVICKKLFEEFRGEYVRLVGIRLTSLRKGKMRQKTLSQWL